MCLQNNIILHAVIAAVMVASIVPMIIRMCPNPKEAGCYRKEKIHQQTIKLMASSKKISNPLKTVTPSGKADHNFFESVYQVVRQIPRGRVTSYGAIAAVLGTKLSARMVGWAMHGASNVKPKVPAHRVVNRNGMLSGKHHFATPSRMQELLEREGIKVKNDVIVDFKQRFWDPAEELGF